MDPNGNPLRVAFENIVCMTLERFFNKYVNSNGDEAHRFVNVGRITVDIKLMIQFLTKDPSDQS